MTAGRMIRGVGVLGLVVAVAAGVAVVVGVLPISGITGDGSAAAATATPERATVAVEQRTMTVEETLDGSLGYGGERRVVNQLAGTVTRLPGIGSTLERGDPLYELDELTRPILMYGSRPAWRTLDEDSDDGADIRQLEANLEALGYLDGEEVDRTWDDETTDAVEVWQEATRQEVDGVVDLGEVVFLYGSIRVTERPAELGARVGPGQPVLVGTSEHRVVTIDLEADRTDLMATGDTVTIGLPDGSTTTGTVSEVGTVAQATTDDFGQAGTPTIEVTIGLDDPAASEHWDHAPVSVDVVRETRDDVLAVPVNALLALLEGGYAVEVVAEDGTSRLVGVELGIFQDGWVEVRGNDLHAGDQVAVPS
jgi:multidrug efflux pump subunit AcrA (membrane-fusion protein)